MVEQELKTIMNALVGKRYNPKDIKINGFHLHLTKCDDLFADEDYRYLWEIQDNGIPLMSGYMWYLPTRVKKVVYITEISID